MRLKNVGTDVDSSATVRICRKSSSAADTVTRLGLASSGLTSHHNLEAPGAKPSRTSWSNNCERVCSGNNRQHTASLIAKGCSANNSVSSVLQSRTRAPRKVVDDVDEAGKGGSRTRRAGGGLPS